MAGKYTWKLLVTGAVLLFAVLNLIPLRNTEFETYITEKAAAQPEFSALAEQARERQTASGGEKSFYVSLREIADEAEIDLSRFFPDVRLEQSLVNVRKRNMILLEHLLEQSRGKIKLGLDLRGGVSIVLEVDESQVAAAAPGAAGSVERQEELEKAIQIISDRIDAFGVAEPIIRPVGENRIEVQLADVSTRENPDIINLIQKPARLEFNLVYMFGTPDTMPQDRVPPIYRPMTLEDERGGQPHTEQLYVKMVPEMTGEAVEYAAAQYNQYGSPEISLQFTSEGARRFAEVTREIEQENVRNRRGEGSYGRLAIILDGKLYSAPSVREEIAGGSAVIYGSFTAREAQDLADVLNNPLDLPLRIAEMSEVGPSLAQDSIDAGQRAFLWAVAITATFITVYYTAAGLLAVLSMLFNVVVIAGVMASIGTTMSMPGIAGLVLTLGMAVDSNILIFERMREELATGKNLRASLEAGFEKAFSAILDANVTTLIVAAIMMSLGTGPVKGFGVVLTIGIFSTMFAALLVSRVLLELTIHTNLIKRLKFLSFVPDTSIDFMRFFRPAFITSWTIVLIGAIMVFVKGSDIYGVDFSGGDELALTFEQRVDAADVRAAAQLAGVNDVTPVYSTPIGGTTEQLKLQTPFQQGDMVLAKLNELHPEAGFQLEATSRIGASVSSQIKWNAAFAIALSLVGILLYVAFRFEMGYGVGAVIATVHDLFMTIGIFVMCGRQFNAVMVGAILLVVGYSINDTIVVFDRIREELALNPNMRLRDVINLSLNRTLQRTVITGATTFFASLILFLVAGGAVNDLALTLIIGIVVGTFSSIFIASPVFFWWHKGDRKHVEASHDITPKYEWSASSRAAQ